MSRPLPDLDALSPAELLRAWADVMRRLRDLGVVRSGNNPVGDICEGLVAAHYGVTPETNSRAGYDVLTPDKRRVQVKGRRTTPTSKPTHYSFIRDLPAKPFDELVAVHLDENFEVTAAYRMSWETVSRLSTYIERVNGWRLPLIRGPLASVDGVEPIDLSLPA